ncbi:MAG: hypothetical protein ABEI97_05235, partial [Candidatus Nanohaloarchaea archaeon]
MQSPGRSIPFLVVLAISLAAVAAAQTPSHPLSEISPSDSNLNLSNNNNVNPHNLSGTGWLVPAGSTLNVAGDLDIQDNSLLDYFGSACGSEEAVQDVNDDGSFTCVSITGAGADTYVNRSGDTMTGELNMSWNNLSDI